MERHWAVAIALIALAAAAAAFGRRALQHLLEPAVGLPAILRIHILLSAGWLMLFLAQAALAGQLRFDWHRRLGRLGLVVGSLIPPVGIATAVAMARFHIARGEPDDSASMAGPFADMAGFAFFLWLAVPWRAGPAVHRRAMVMCTCVLATAAFARAAPWLVPGHPLIGAYALALLAMGRDWLVERRLHPVFLAGLPALALAQLGARSHYVEQWPPWVAFAHWMTH
jgi:hypothetical protein